MRRFAWIALLAAWPAMAQLLDLSALDKLADKAEEASTVELGPEQLKLGANFLSGQGAEGGDLKQLLSKVRAIRIRSFEFATEGAYTLADLDAVRKQITADKAWTPIVRVKEKREMVEVYLHSGANGGLVVLAAEPKELSVINISGSLNLEDLSRIGGQFGIPNMNMGRSTPKPPATPAPAPKPPKQEEEER